MNSALEDPGSKAQDAILFCVLEQEFDSYIASLRPGVTTR